MPYVGEARAAISVVNALPLGIGSAIGVEWIVRATVTLEEGEGRGVHLSVDPPGSETPLVQGALRSALRRFAPARHPAVTLQLESTVPQGRGLKSSSAVSSAVVLAAARAVGREPDVEEVARLAAEIGRSTGTSATGAFDDALAGLVPGGVVTDNRYDTVLRRFNLDPGLRVALWIPEGEHPRSPEVRRRFARDPARARRAVDAALAGDWARAMILNSELVEHAMGYPYGPLRDALLRAGARAAGVTGLGPAIAAVAPAEAIDRVLSALPTDRGSCRTLRPSSVPTAFAGGAS